MTAQRALFGVVTPDPSLLGSDFLSVSSVTPLQMASDGRLAVVRVDYYDSQMSLVSRHFVYDLVSATYGTSIESVISGGSSELVHVESVVAYFDTVGYRLAASFVDFSDPLVDPSRPETWASEKVALINSETLASGDLIADAVTGGGNRSVSGLAFSSDGLGLAVQTEANNYVTDIFSDQYDTDLNSDVYLVNTLTHAVTRTSILGGIAAGGDVRLVGYQTQSGVDYVLLETSATNWIYNDTNSAPDLFLYRSDWGFPVAISETVDGDALGYESGQAIFSGSTVLFVSRSDDFSGAQQDGLPELFSYNLNSGVVSDYPSGLDSVVKGNQFAIQLLGTSVDGVLVQLTDAQTSTAEGLLSLDGQLLLVPLDGSSVQVVSATVAGELADEAIDGAVIAASGEIMMVTDADNLSDEVGLNAALSSTLISVSDIYDVSVITDTDSTSDVVSESAASSTAVGVTAFAEDADKLMSGVTYSLFSDTSGAFSIHATTGVLTVADPSLLNYEVVTSHQVTVRATSADGSHSDKTLTIAVTDDTSEFSVTVASDADSGTNSVSESASSGSAVGVTASATDGDGSDTVSYELINPDGRFSIHATTGVLTVANPSLLNYEVATSHQVTVRAVSSDGSLTDTVFTVGVGDDTSEFAVTLPADSDSATNAVAEGASAGTAVGVQALATDSDGSDVVSYGLVNPDGRFAVNSVTGVVTVADPSLLNYEAATSHQVTVRATSTDGTHQDKTFTIDLIDVDEHDVGQSVDTNSLDNAVSEGSVNGSLVGVTAYAADLDGTNNTVSYALSNDSQGRFEIDPSTGVVSVKDISAIDFAVSQSYSVTVTASSSDGSSSNQSFTIEQNSRPVFDGGITSYGLSYSGALVSTALTVPVPSDVQETLTSVTVAELPIYGALRVSGVAVSVGDTIAVADLGSLSFEVDLNVKGPIGSVTLRATDGAGLSDDWSASVSVNGAAGLTNGSSGNDLLYGSIDADIINAGNGNDEIRGGPGNDVIDGGGGNDTLIGGTGFDILKGGPGDDDYYVEDTDAVVELYSGSTGGYDRVFTEINFNASTNVEELVATGSGSVTLNGNILNNRLTGNAAANALAGGEGSDTLIGLGGNDTLDGGLGRDRMEGGDGDDEYVVDATTDIVYELDGAGTDHVFSSTNHTLGNYIENLTLTGTGDIAGSGNGLNNIIIGNSGNNLISGGAGNDQMRGGDGDDTYVVDSALDVIVDTSGTDTVRSSISYTLQDGLENGVLLGIRGADLTGNAASNELTGNLGANVLDGKGGADTLTGGFRADTFVSSVSDGTYDTITDFLTGTDEIAIYANEFGLDSLSILDGVTQATLDLSNFATIGSDGQSSNVDAQIIYDTRDQILRIDADGSGAGAAEAIFALAGTGTVLGFDDIYLFKDS